MEWECAGAEVWIEVGRPGPVAREALGGSEAAGAATAVDLEDVGEWKEEASVALGGEDPLWTEWAAEVEEEWARPVERWI